MRRTSRVAAAVLLTATATLLVRAQAPEAQPDFAAWLEGVRIEALQRGLSPAVVDTGTGVLRQRRAGRRTGQVMELIPSTAMPNPCFWSGTPPMEVY